MPSFCEEHSISVLGAIAYGLPAVKFRNFECVEDLNNEWNRGYIVEHSKYLLWKEWLMII